MNNINLEHAKSIYDDIVNGDPNVTKDLGQLYFAIKMLGDELVKKEEKCSTPSMSQS